MLVLFVSLNAMERVCCPDGCTHEQQSTSNHHAPDGGDGACLLCLGGIVASVHEDLSPSDAPIAGVVPPPLARYLDAPPDSVEHPPRT